MKNPVKKAAPSSPATRVVFASASFESAVVAYAPSLAGVGPDAVLSQDDLAAAAAVRKTGKLADATFKTFRGVAEAVRSAAPGPLQILWTDTGRNSTPWKKIAFELAERVAKLEGRAFDPRAFEAAMEARAVKGDTEMPEIVRAGIDGLHVARRQPLRRRADGAAV